MIAFPSMLVSAASKAGIKVPNNPDQFEELKDEYPHFYVYCMLQLGRPILYGMTSHWSNAEIIASIPDSDILNVTVGEVFALGFV